MSVMTGLTVAPRSLYEIKPAFVRHLQQQGFSPVHVQSLGCLVESLNRWLCDEGLRPKAFPALALKRVTMHVLRHGAAMRLMSAGAEQAVIALWLGHEQIGTTDIYLHADMAIKERALARMTPAASAA